MVGKESKASKHDDFMIENNFIKCRTLPYEVKDYNIGKLILDSLNNEPNHIGQIFGKTGDSITFAEMKKRSVRCALWMKKCGIGPKDVVSICTNNQLDDYIPVLATFYLGAIYSPWYYGIDLQEARRLIHLLRPKLIFASESAVDTLLKAANEENIRTKIVVIDRKSKLITLHELLEEQPFIQREIEEFHCTEIADSSKTCMILLSLGSLGPAKCVEQSAGSVVQYFHECKATETRHGARSLWYASLHWFCGTIHFVEWLINGHTRVLHKNYDPEDTCKIIDKYEVEILILPLTLIKDLLRQNVFERYKLSSIKCISIWGSYLSREIVDELEKYMPHAQIDNSYGFTEVGSRCNDPKRRSTKLGSIGFVKSNMQMKVIDPKTNEILGSNKIGEFCFKSATGMTGYYKDPENTKKVIDDEGWIHSGDLGYYDENGEIVFRERLGDIMRFRDNEISPVEIENALNDHPEVEESCVIPIPHDDDNHHPMAFVKKRPGSKVTEDELVKVSSKLGESKKLRGGVKFIDKMPRTEAGVIHKKSLKEMAKALAFL